MILARAIVCLAAAIPYLSTIDDYFVQDDFGVVWLLARKPWSSFPGWFTSSWMDDIWGFTADEIRPFPALTFQVAAIWGGGSPVANHVLNIALHAGNGLLVLAIARSIARLSVAAATCAALAFVLLPVQAESVAWVTGRVDSMPAFVYLAAFFLYARWRQDGDGRLYWGALAAFFVALFTKQNVITLGPALVLYDLLIARQPIRFSWDWLLPYVPFALLTIGYLALRYVLFGDVARESQLTASGLEFFGTLVVRHLRRMMFGDVAYGGGVLWSAVAVLLAVVSWAAPRATLFFVLAWWALGVAPVIVAAYESPRHIYLASLAWAMLLGLAFDLVPRIRVAQAAAAAAASVLLTVYAVQLVRTVETWSTRSRVSQQAVVDLEREARTAPAGSLIVAAAPTRSWEWALPFVLRRPFVATDLDSRVTVVTPQALSCCRAQWESSTRKALEDWLARSEATPLVALRWDAESGALFRITDREEPYLRALVRVIASTDSAAALERAILQLTEAAPPAR